MFSDIAIETNVVACLLKSEEAWQRLPDGIGSEDFTSTLLRGIFTVADYLYNQGQKIDWVTISSKLPDDLKQELKTVGDWAYLDALHDLPIDPGNIEFEAKTLKDLTIRRRMHEAGGEIAEVSKAEKDVELLLNEVEIIVNNIPSDSGTEVVSIGKDGLEFIQAKMVNPQDVPGLPSGFKEFDAVVQGFQPGRLYVVAARKKVGKSAMLLNWAKHLCVDQGEPILWISTEHSLQDEFSRLLAMVSGVPERLINNGKFSESLVQIAKVEDAVDQIEKSKFYFCSMPEFTLSKIKRITRKYARVHGVKAMYFDYIKPPSENSKMAEWQELGRLTFGLKALAEKEKLPVISAAQLNREGVEVWKEDGDLSFDQAAGSDRIGHALSYGLILRPLNKRERDKAGFAGEEARVLEVADTRHGGGDYKRLLNFKGETLIFKEGATYGELFG